MSENTNTKCCTYCNEEIEGNDYKRIVRFNQPDSILRNFRELKVCNNCIAIMLNRDELSTDWADRYGADYNLVIDRGVMVMIASLYCEYSDSALSITAINGNDCILVL